MRSGLSRQIIGVVQANYGTRNQQTISPNRHPRENGEAARGLSVVGHNLETKCRAKRVAGLTISPTLERCEP